MSMNFHRKLPIPQEVKKEYSLSERMVNVKAERDEKIRAVFNGSSDKFILVINSGAAIDMSFVEEIQGINAILYICQLGTEGGHAVADILSGKVSPSGKLADTWAKKYLRKNAICAEESVEY